MKKNFYTPGDTSYWTTDNNFRSYDSYLQCKKCGEMHSRSQYQWKKTGGLNSQTCKECRSKNTAIVNSLRKKYPFRDGMKCDVCKATLVRGQATGKQKNAVLDHDYHTGLFRGYVCKECNMAAGLVGDNYEGAKKLYEYFVRHKKREKYLLARKKKEEIRQDGILRKFFTIPLKKNRK